MKRWSFALAVVVVCGGLVCGQRSARAADATSSSEELAQGERELASARALSENAAIDRRQRADSALVHFTTSYELLPTWSAAAGALDSQLVLGSTAAASGWYWLAADASDYSEAYLAWQTATLARLFDARAAFTFEFSSPPQTLRIDGVAVPPGAQARPLALELGTHSVTASTPEGDTYQGSISVLPKDVGLRQFFPVKFVHHLRAGEVDPDLPQIGPRPKEKEGMGALQIATIVTTVALASGIAIGGGYLLFGQDNPRGLDTPEGAAIVITELALIGGGTVIALISD